MKTKQLLSCVLIFLFGTCIFFGNPFLLDKHQPDKSNSVITFLDSHYLKKYYLGKSAETVVDTKTLIVSEIINPANKKFLGYVVSQKSNNKILYLIDYNTYTSSINIINLIDNTTDIVLFDSESDFKVFTTVDLLNGIGTENDSPVTRRKFIGKSCGSSFSIEPGSCNRVCCYYILWHQNGCKTEKC